MTITKLILSYRNHWDEVVSFLEEHLNIKSDSRPETGEHLLLQLIMQYSNMQVMSRYWKFAYYLHENYFCDLKLCD